MTSLNVIGCDPTQTTNTNTSITISNSPPYSISSYSGSTTGTNALNGFYIIYQGGAFTLSYQPTPPNGSYSSQNSSFVIAYTNIPSTSTTSLSLNNIILSFNPASSTSSLYYSVTVQNVQIVLSGFNSTGQSTPFLNNSCSSIGIQIPNQILLQQPLVEQSSTTTTTSVYSSTIALSNALIYQTISSQPPPNNGYYELLPLPTSISSCLLLQYTYTLSNQILIGSYDFNTDTFSPSPGYTSTYNICFYRAPSNQNTDSNTDLNPYFYNTKLSYDQLVNIQNTGNYTNYPNGLRGFYSEVTLLSTFSIWSLFGAGAFGSVQQNLSLSLKANNFNLGQNTIASAITKITDPNSPDNSEFIFYQLTTNNTYSPYAYLGVYNNNYTPPT